MRQHAAHIQTLEPVVDLGYEPVPVSFDVEYCPLLHRIRGGKCLSDIREILPGRFLWDAKPGVQCCFEVRVAQRCFSQLFAADHMHGMARGGLRTLQTSCSQRANLSRGVKPRPNRDVLSALTPTIRNASTLYAHCCTRKMAVTTFLWEHFSILHWPALPKPGEDGQRYRMDSSTSEIQFGRFRTSRGLGPSAAPTMPSRSIRSIR